MVATTTIGRIQRRLPVSYDQSCQTSSNDGRQNDPVCRRQRTASEHKGACPTVHSNTYRFTLKAVRVSEFADETPGDPALHELVTELRANQAEVKRLASKLDKSCITSLTERSVSPNPRSPSPRHVSFVDHSRRPASPTGQDRQYRDNRRPDGRPQQNNRSSPWNGRYRNGMPNQQNARPQQRNPNTPSYQPRPASDVNQWLLPLR
jgi:hypothetical protein